MHAGKEGPQEKVFSVTSTLQDCTEAFKPIPTAPEVRASSQRPLTMEEIQVRQCKLRELCRLASVSRPDICARPAQLAAEVNSSCRHSPQGIGAYRMNDLPKLRRSGSRPRRSNIGPDSTVAPRRQQVGRILPMRIKRKMAVASWAIKLASYPLPCVVRAASSSGQRGLRVKL